MKKAHSRNPAVADVTNPARANARIAPDRDHLHRAAAQNAHAPRAMMKEAADEASDTNTNTTLSVSVALCLSQLLANKLVQAQIAKH
jgi:hypothetical protein